MLDHLEVDMSQIYREVNKVADSLTNHGARSMDAVFHNVFALPCNSARVWSLDKMSTLALFNLFLI